MDGAPAPLPLKMLNEMTKIAWSNAIYLFLEWSFMLLIDFHQIWILYKSPPMYDFSKMKNVVNRKCATEEKNSFLNKLYKENLLRPNYCVNDQDMRYVT